MKYSRTPEFEKDFKKLLKSYRSLEKDFENMKKSLLKPCFEDESPVPPKALRRMEGFCGNNYESFKIKKFACKALKGTGGSSGIRVIFVYQKTEQKITFIEIYYKGDKENEDRKRLQLFIDGINNSVANDRVFD